MARKISEIYDRLNVVKSTFQELHDYVVDASKTYSAQDTWATLLADITSASKVAVWRLMMWLFATGSWIVQTLFDKLILEVTDILSAKKPHTLRWYAEESKKFQLGYAMIWKDDMYQYERIDPDAQIVKYSAAAEKNGKVILKLAAEVGGQKLALDYGQKAAITEFWSQWKDAGVKLEIVSQAADILKINILIVRDRLVLNGNNSLIRDASVFPIDVAIDTYGKNLEFNGVIVLSELCEKIKAAEGVIDVKLISAQHKPAGGSYTMVDMSVEAASGYFVIDQGASTYAYKDNIIVSIE